MIMFDSIIQLKQSLIEIDRRIRIIGCIYSWFFIQMIKHKIHKLKDTPVSANLILGFYKFVLDTNSNIPGLNKYNIFYSPSDERDWMRTIIIEDKKTLERASFTVYNGDRITVQYDNTSMVYDITVDSHLLNFEYSPDRYNTLISANTIFMDCMMAYIDMYLDLKGR